MEGSHEQHLHYECLYCHFWSISKENKSLLNGKKVKVMLVFANTTKKSTTCSLFRELAFESTWSSTSDIFCIFRRLVARLIPRWVCRGRWYAWLDDKTETLFKGNVNIDLVFIQALFSRNFQHGLKTGKGGPEAQRAGIPQTSWEILPERRGLRRIEDHETAGRLFIPSQ